MFRTLMASTALAMVLAGPVAATEHAKTKAGENAAMTEDNSRYERVLIVKGVTIGEQQVEGYLASNLMGANVYAGTGEEAEIVGDINDILVSDNGEIKAVIVGVGGFLGMGEKDVAIDFDRISVQDQGEDGFRLTASVDKNELEKTAAFELDRDHDEEMTTGSVDTMSNEDETAATDKSRSGFAENDPRWTDADRDYMTKAKRVDALQISADQMIGVSVYGADRNSLGEVGDIMLDKDGKVDAVVIDVGGFLGLGEKPVAVSFSSLQIFRENNDRLTIMTPFTESELEQATAFDKEKYDTDRDAIVLSGK